MGPSVAMTERDVLPDQAWSYLASKFTMVSSVPYSPTLECRIGGDLYIFIHVHFM